MDPALCMGEYLEYKAVRVAKGTGIEGGPLRQTTVSIRSRKHQFPFLPLPVLSAKMLVNLYVCMHACMHAYM